MDIYEELIRERGAGATIVNAVGSVPSQATAKLLLRADGTIVGTVGGGASEAAVIKEAKQVLASGKPKLAMFDLRENPRMDIGMVCGGSLNVFIEPIRPAPVAYLFGTRHVGALTAAAARIARIDVEVIDDRPEFACRDRFPDARAIHNGDIDTTLAFLKPDASLRSSSSPGAATNSAAPGDSQRDLQRLRRPHLQGAGAARGDHEGTRRPQAPAEGGGMRTAFGALS